jgi:hypothetical protein
VKRPRWLWDGRIPIGKLSLLVGEEGTGKGALEQHLIVEAIRGQLPGDRLGLPQRVLVVGDEDGFDDTWVPRLIAAGASQSEIDEMVRTLGDGAELTNMARQYDEFLALVRGNEIGWIILDQLLDHVPGGTDGSGVYNPKHVRDILVPIRRVAEESSCALTGNLHPVKGAPKSFRDLVAGSHQFNAVSRSSLYLGRDPDSDDRNARVLVRGKGNLGPEPPCLEFEIESKRFEFNGDEFNEPRVANVREGNRYRDDFDGGRGHGFGQEGTHKVPAHRLIADDVQAALSDEPQSASKIGRDISQNRNKVGDTLTHLEDLGIAKRGGRGWILDPDPPPPPPV